MIRLQALAWLTVGGLSLSTGLSALAETKFKPVIATDAVRFVTAWSPDQQIGTIIFDNLSASTAPGKGELPGVETRRFVHVLTIEGDRECDVEIMVRGYVSHTGSGSASLLIHSHGASKLVDFDQAIKEADSRSHPPTAVTAAQAEVLADNAGFERLVPERSDDFFVCLKRRIPAGGGKLQSSLILLVDRLDDGEGSGALLTVDTIDLAIHPVTQK